MVDVGVDLTIPKILVLKHEINKAKFYVIKREPGAEIVNPYNEHLLHAWRAYLDIQVVSSMYFVCDTLYLLR